MNPETSHFEEDPDRIHLSKQRTEQDIRLDLELLEERLDTELLSPAKIIELKANRELLRTELNLLNER